MVVSIEGTFYYRHCDKQSFFYETVGWKIVDMFK